MTTFSADPSRRAFLRSALASGLLVVPGSAVLAGCATAGGGGNPEQAKGAQSKDNPLGVDAGAGLEVVMFDGGLKTSLPEVQATYTKLFPNAKINLTSTVNINSLQPRFSGGNPPDVIDDSGAQKIPLATLVGGGQLTDLGPLLDAPSLADPSKKVRDTVVPETIDAGSFDGRTYVINYALYVYGLWYSAPLFAKNGWKFPTMWSDFVALGEEMKKAGLSPMAYGGTNAAQYVTEMLLTMAGKAGGSEVLLNIDNLAPGAWKHDAVKNAATAVEEAARKGFFLPGSPGLKHTQAQTEFVNGKVACYASGSWLENEMKTVSPKGFDMVMAPTPRLDNSDKLPVETLHSNPGESFIVPAKARNARGGLEFLRHMLHPDNAAAFSKLTANLTIVKEGNTRVQSDSTALKSVNDSLKAAGSNTLNFLSLVWYGDLNKGAIKATSDLLTGRTNADGFVSAMQTTADKVAGDANVKKYKRG